MSDDHQHEKFDAYGPDVKLTNLTNKEEVYHRPCKTLANRTLYGMGCYANQCQGGMMLKTNGVVCRSNRTKAEVLHEATEYLKEYYRDKHTSGLSAMPERLEQVEKEIEEKGYYFHTYEELSYGMKLAWRNSAKCIMRSQWKNILLLDARGPNAEYGRKITNEEMFGKCVDHLRGAIKIADGNNIIVSQMTVFPQLLPGEEIGRRIWNNHLLRFAGYTQPDGSILGDPANVELTDISLKLGWTPPQERSPFDLLPLIVQASDNVPPYMKEIPEDARITIPIVHPEYPKFAELGIKWFVVPAIANFCLDIGGILYPSIPFNGWYMDAEIGCRNLGDPQRYNLLPVMANLMGLDVNTNHRELAKDKALLELDIAVLHSFDLARTTIIDHQAASESFIRHHQKEMMVRGFIPADWVWVTPPIGGSANQVFHQEMINFFIKPGFLEGQHTLSQLIQRAVDKKMLEADDNKNTSGKGWKKIQSMISVRRFRKVLAKRLQLIYIYYGSETGISEAYAKGVRRFIESLGGNVKVVAFGTLDELNLSEVSLAVGKHTDSNPEVRTTALLIIVTSTFGAGGPPKNGEKFLTALKHENSVNLTSVDVAVFGMGSSLYPNTNSCALFIETRLRDLHANILLTGFGDETKDPAGSFNKWRAQLIQHTLCDKELFSKKSKNVFQLKDASYSVNLTDTASSAAGSETKQSIMLGKLVERVELSSEDKREAVRFDFDLHQYNWHVEEGDHLAVLPKNQPRDVDRMINILKVEANKYLTVTSEIQDDDDKIIPEFLEGRYTIRTILEEHIDLNAPPSFDFVKKAALFARAGSNDRIVLQFIALNVKNYRSWITDNGPSQVDFFTEFESLSERMPLPIFLMNAPRIATRLYSISSSPIADKGKVVITVRSEYVKGQKAPSRQGLCTNYLSNLRIGDADVRMYICPSPSFHLDQNVPVVMISNGTGIAPFRSFWRTLALKPNSAEAPWMYFGCRDKVDNMYEKELQSVFKEENLRFAFSRGKESPKQYVSDIVLADGARIREFVEKKNAKIYICGTLRMAEGMHETLATIFGGKNEFQALVARGKYAEEVF